MTRRRVAVALASTLALLLPTAAQAVPTWLEPVDLIPAALDTSSSGVADIAVAPDGTVIAAWVRRAGSEDREKVEVSIRPPGGVFSQPVVVSPVQAGVYGSALDMKMAMDAAGNTTMVWEQVESVEGATRTVIRQSTRPVGGVFGVSTQLSNTSVTADRSVLAVSPDGETVVAWGEANAIFVRTRPAGGTFGDAEPVTTENGTVRGLDIAVNDAGTAALIVQKLFSGVSRIQGTIRPAAGSSFPAAVYLSAEVGSVAGGDVAIDPQGNATAVWTHNNGSNLIAQSSTRPANLPGFVGVQDLSAVGQSAADAHVAVDTAGTAIAVWWRNNGANYIVQSAIRAAGSSFGNVQDLSAVGQDSIDPEVRLDGKGNAIVTWAASGPAGDFVQAITRAAGGLFGAVQSVSKPGEVVKAPRIATDAAGNGAAVWRSYDQATETNMIVKVAGFDAVAPAFTSMTVPAGGVTGDELSFEAATFDTWSAVEVKWEFGDGQAATGTSVKHAYADPGDKTMTITATDAVGNRTTETRTLKLVLPDRDSDGSATDRDCNDGNAAIKPGAVEVTDNNVDEDCDGVDAINLDRDRDGFNRPDDCDDANPAIHRGVPEKRGNAVDEDCDGVKLPFLRITSGINRLFVPFRRYTTVRRFIIRDAPVGAVAEVRCRGGGCPKKAKKLTSKGAKELRFTSYFAKRKLRPGAIVEVRITLPDQIGKFARYVMRARKAPKATVLCLPPGQTKPIACPQGS